MTGAGTRPVRSAMTAYSGSAPRASDGPPLASPAHGGAVGAVAGPVEGHADDRAGRVVAVVGEAGDDVGVVVLDALQVDAPVVGQLEGVLGGQVLRVQVVRHHLRVDVEQPAEVLDALGERAQRLGVLQVPDVVRDEGVVTPGQAERVLELGAAGQHAALEAGFGGDRLRDVAAGTADEHGAAAGGPGHRAGGPDVDG